MKRTAIFFCLLLACSTSCDDLNTALPESPGEIPPPPPSDFKLVGHWEAESTQGRRIAFDVITGRRVVNGRINIHHECTDGRWRVTFDGFNAAIVDNAFLVTVNWENNDGGITRAGSYTISGRFEGPHVVRGGLINSVDDVRKDDDPTGDACTTVDVAFEGGRPK